MPEVARWIGKMAAQGLPGVDYLPPVVTGTTEVADGKARPEHRRRPFVGPNTVAPPSKAATSSWSIAL